MSSAECIRKPIYNRRSKSGHRVVAFPNNWDKQYKTNAEKKKINTKINQQKNIYIDFSLYVH